MVYKWWNLIQSSNGNILQFQLK